MRWDGSRVAIDDSVAMPSPITGKALEESYWADIGALTFGLARIRDGSIFLGPFELIRLGRPRFTKNSVQWPIEGGLLARSPSGRLRFEALYGRLVASVEGYEPMLPRVLYSLTQRPIHHLWTRLHLLRVRGRQPAPGPAVERSRRLAAAAIDVGFCLTLAAVVGRKRRVPVLIGAVVGYHVACWSTSGRTIGGAIMKQRVVSIDGSRPTAGQALVRLGALPVSALRKRNVHDEVAGTAVVADRL